jgi:hypothetical protein
MAEEDEKESAQAENSAIGADRFRIAFNAATGVSVANDWRWQSTVLGRAVSISGRQANSVVRHCRHRPISWPALAAEHHCRQMAVELICQQGQQARRLLAMLPQGCLPEWLGPARRLR